MALFVRRIRPHPAVNRLAERVRPYFARRPEEYRPVAVGRGLALRGGPTSRPWFADRPALSEEDIRPHVWLNQRLALLHRERYGLWPSMRRFLFGTRPIR